MKFQASVKVMRSYDYCHFEVNLATDQQLDVAEVDDMRRVAASLVDRAVDDYKRMKAHDPARLTARYQRAEMEQRLADIKQKPEGERTINEVAMLKRSEDAEFWAKYKDDEEFDYWNDREVERDHHFERLRNRERVRV